MNILAPSALRQVMPVAAYIGGNGDIVLCQEWTCEKEERYLRIVVPLDDAMSHATEIMRLARCR